MKVIIINGQGGCGKDKFVSLCKNNFPNTFNFSTADPVKEMAKIMGWTGEKSQSDRLFLARLKEAWEEYNQGTSKYILTSINAVYKPNLEQVAFVHCREPKNIDALKSLLKDKYDVITLLITRDSVKDDFENDADKYVFDYKYDYVIENNGTIDDLNKSAIAFIGEIL